MAESRVALIAGASSGMGRATAIALADAGLSVVVFARRSQRLADLCATIATAGGRALPVTGDATQAADLQRAASEAVAAYGRLDVVVNCVGTNSSTRALSQIDEPTWRELIDVNLTAAFHLTTAVLPVFRSQRRGQLIHVASTAARFPDASGVGYQASKAGVAALAFATQVEEGENGVRTTVVYPGLTDTDLVAKRPIPPSEQELRSALQPEDIAAVCRSIVVAPERVHIPEIVVRPAPSADHTEAH